MKPKSLRVEFEQAVAYGIGFAAGKHNLPFTKKQIKEISKKYTNKLSYFKK